MAPRGIWRTLLSDIMRRNRSENRGVEGVAAMTSMAGVAA